MTYRYLTPQTLDKLMEAGYSFSTIGAINRALEEGLVEWLAEIGVGLRAGDGGLELFHQDLRFPWGSLWVHMKRGGDPLKLERMGLRLGVEWYLADELMRDVDILRVTWWKDAYQCLEYVRKQQPRFENGVEYWRPLIVKAWERFKHEAELADPN